MDNERLDNVPTQPPEFKLPYGWIELHSLNRLPFYVRASEIRSLAVHFEATVPIGCSINLTNDSRYLCRETPEEVMEKITKSYPSISERFGGCI